MKINENVIFLNFISESDVAIQQTENVKPHRTNNEAWSMR